MICSAARIPGAMMRSCGSCSAWEKMAAGSGQSESRQRTAALPSRLSPFRMHRRLRGRFRPPSLCRKRRLHLCQRRSQRPYRKHRLRPRRQRSRNPYSRSPKRSQGRSAPLDRAGTRTKAREEAQPCTEAGCSAQARQSIQPQRTGALGQKTEALRTEKRQKAHRSDGFPACGLFHIHAGSVPV